MNTDILKRVPPQNLDAEQSVIGAVIIKNGLFDEIAEIIATDDFYRETHRIMWDAICALAAAKKPIDAITMAEALRPELEAIGGISYLAECVDAAISTAFAIHHAHIIREKSIARGLVTVGHEIANRAFEAPSRWSPEWTEEQLALAEYEVAQVASKQIRKPERGKADTLSEVLWNLEHGVESAVATGFATLDRSFGGCNIGHVTFIAARTSKGKTAFATNIAINAAKAGIPTAYFTLEMTADEMWLRALGCEAQVDMFCARRRGYREGERERIEAAEKLFGRIPLEILYRPPMRPRDLRLECCAGIAFVIAILLPYRASAQGTGAQINEAAVGQTLYVDQSNVLASDSNPGTDAQPFLTIGRAVTAAALEVKSGTDVVIGPGTYRESINLNGAFSASDAAPFILEASEPGQTIITGSDVWTGWQNKSFGIYSHPWPYSWGSAPTPSGWPALSAIVTRREMAFVNGTPLQQVLSTQLPGPGTFNVVDGCTITIWPATGTVISSATVEVATREGLLQTPNGISQLVLRGLTFEHDSTAVNAVGNGAVKLVGGSNILVDNCVFDDNNWLGLSISGGPAQAITVENSRADHNGENGFRSPN